MSHDARTVVSRERQREVEQCLARHGLDRKPRPLRAVGHGETGEETPGPRMSRAFRELGPAYVLFGRYLASRPDLLAPRDCLCLDELDEKGEPLGEPAARLEQELGRRAWELFAGFDEDPVAVSLTDQLHRAQLSDGRSVWARLGHFPPRHGPARELAEVSCLESSLKVDFSLAEALDDYRQALASRLDFTVQAAALEALARDNADSGLLAVPEVVVAVSSPGVLCIEELQGGRPLARHDKPSENRELARRFMLMWLAQVMVGRFFPVEGEVLELPDGRVAIVSGRFARLPSASQPHLWEYVRHTVAHRVDEACEHLVRELRPASRYASESALHLRLRQVVPFRDGGWSERGDTMAEHLVLHWRLARQCGFRPQAHLQSFYEGLFWAARLTRRLHPEGDSLREAQEDLRWQASWQQLRQFVDPRGAAESLESNLASLMELPQKLDRVLNVAMSDEAPLRLRVDRPAGLERRKDSLAQAIALGALMLAVALLGPRLAAAGLLGHWGEQGMAVAFLALGAWLLKTIGGAK